MFGYILPIFFTKLVGQVSVEFVDCGRGLADKEVAAVPGCLYKVAIGGDMLMPFYLNGYQA